MKPRRLNDTDRAVLTVLVAQGHPLTTSEIGIQVYSKHEGWDGDPITHRRVMGLLTSSLVFLRDQHRVWQPLRGYWAFAGPDSSERFFGWLAVLADGFDEGTLESPGRAVSILTRFCTQYGPNKHLDAALDCALLRLVMFQVFLVLLRRGGGLESVGQVADIALIDRALVIGLDKNQWLEKEQIGVLLGEIVNYVSRTTTARTPTNRGLSTALLVRLARQADLELSIVFKNSEGWT